MNINQNLHKIMTTYKTLLESIQVEVPEYIEKELPEFFESIVSIYKAEILKKIFGPKYSIASKIVGNHEYFENNMLMIVWERLDTDFIEISLYSFFPKEP